jgi:FHA domain
MEPRWLISYTPGTCVVLAGPTAVVALDPGSDPDGDPVADLWSQLHAGVGVRDLVGQLARIDMGRLPRLAVLFFETSNENPGEGAQGLRALLRGNVRVLSDTGQTIAHGEDVLTWQEVRLAGLERFELDLGGGQGESLPLVHGGVRAGRLRLVAGPADATPHAVPTAVPVAMPPDAAEPPFGTAHRPAPDPLDDDTGPIEDTEPMTAPFPGDDEADRSAAVEEMENADTALMVLPPPPTPAVIARLRAPDGSTVDLDRPVLIGRAPSDAGFENAQPHLLTVLSPSQDISRTHVLVAPEGDAIVVTDLHSTNGTTLVRPGPAVDREPLPSGQSVSVEVGTVLELGDEVAILVDAAQ